MLKSLFILSSSTDCYLEKHWEKITPKSVCDVLLDEITKGTSPSGDIPTVLGLSQETLICLCKNSLYFVAVCINEIPPLLVIDFLHAFTNVISDYFGGLTDTIIRDNLVCIFEILDEMLDGGFPLSTEPNVLKELVVPPSLLRSMTDMVTGRTSSVSTTLPSAQLSNVRWRRSEVKYTNNEVYFDLIEKLNVIIDPSGNTVFKGIQGAIDCFIKLSGVPDLTLAFNNHRVIDDVSLHPCIRFLRWKRERILSFIPPDGRFCLLNYQLNSLSPVNLPITIRHTVSLREHGSRFDLVVIPKTCGKPVESVKLQCRMPDSVVSMHLTTNTGRASFDSTSHCFVWDIGRIEQKHANPSLKGTVTLANTSDMDPPSNPPVMVTFVIPQFACSGLKIARVDLYGEKYKPFKGVKYVTRSGQFEVRT